MWFSAAPLRCAALVGWTAVAILAPGCSSSSSKDEAAERQAAESCDGAVPTAVAGPFAAGVTTVINDGVTTEVWYPIEKVAAVGKKETYDARQWLPAAQRAKVSDANAPFEQTDGYRDAPISRSRPFPVVLFSHGLGGYRLQSAFLMTHLASWGFVVAAPEHLERGLAVVLEGDLTKISDKAPEQLRSALRFLKAEAAKPDSRFSGTIDSAHVAVIGHSQGGAAASTLIPDAEVGAWVLLASPGFGAGPAGKPLLMMGGTSDNVATLPNLESSFAKQPAGKRFVTINKAGHLAFTDLCLIGRDRGGLLAIAKESGIEIPEIVATLASDGCQPESLPAEQSWPLTRHFVTSSLQTSFGLASPSVTPEVAKRCFGERLASSQSE